MAVSTDSFRFRLIALFGGLSLVVGGSVSLYIEQFAADRIVAANGERMREKSRSIANALSESLIERSRDVQLLSRSPWIARGDWASLEVRLLVQDVKNTYRPYAWIGLADEAGRVVTATDGLLEGVDVSTRPWFVHALDGDIVGDVHEAVLLAKRLQRDDLGEPLRFIDFASPIYDDRGRKLGVIAAHAYWTWVGAVIADALSNDDVASGVAVFVLGKTGEVLHPYSGMGDVAAARGRLPETGHAVVDWPDEGRFLTAVSTVRAPLADELGWQVVVRQPIESALASVAELRLNLILTGVLVAVLFMLIAYRVAVGFSRPIEQLARVANRIAGGDETVSFADRSGIRELKQLFHAFRAMTATLIRRKRELVDINQSLERKVCERTADLEAANRKLAALSATDALTGLANRRRFDEVLASECARAARAGNQIGVIMFDIDHFKEYNDCYGHQVGDQCLGQVADLIQSAVRRAGELAARYGGEEFVVVLGDANGKAAHHLAESIRRTIEYAEMPHEASPSGRVTVSAGVAVMTADSSAASVVVARADQALYRAKRAGRNRVEMSAEPPMVA